MDNKFDYNQAKKFLEKRESIAETKREAERLVIFNEVVKSLRGLFSDTNVEVYLVGSILQPYQFHMHSDIDIILKNFKGDRFEIWTELENMIHRRVEIILFEFCSFQDHVLKHGFKVL